MQPSIEEFRARGGRIEAILGIDETGATEQGLRLAMELFDSVHVFHDPTSRTFHPKVYVAYMGNAAEILVGSSNLTAGGLFSNYEAGLVATLDLSEDNDKILLDQLDAWFQTMLEDVEVCRLLDDQLLELVLSIPGYKIGNENISATHTSAQRDDYDGVVEPFDQRQVFGTSLAPKKGRAPAIGGHKRRSAPGTSRSGAVSGPTPAASYAAAVQTTHRWTKRLSASDAQRPPGRSSNPTGNLKLAQAGNDIDWTTYFRDDMFGSLNWTIERETPRGPKEGVTIPFEVTIAGRDLGVAELHVDHAMFRIANQRNAPTWLHWGPLMPTLQARDYTGSYVVLERLADGRFRLGISESAP